MKNTVFLSHNSFDKPAIETIAIKLKKEKDIEPWLDKWNLVPGDPWQEALEEALEKSNICIIFIGPSGIGPWQNEEMRNAINRRTKSDKGNLRVIPVLLPNAKRGERGRMPAFLTRSTWVEFKESLEEEEPYHYLLCGIRGISPGQFNSEQTKINKCPYQGLSFFDIEDAPYFFGREALTDWLLNELKKKDSNSNLPNRFLAVVGASGSGKSSLVRAGLLHALQIGKITGSENWKQVTFCPGDNPLENLAIALSTKGILGNTPGEIYDFSKRAMENQSYLNLVARLSLTKQSNKQYIVLLVDQFEEIFTICLDESKRVSFINNLIYASTISRGGIILILTMRSDFYGKCAAFDSLSALISDHHLLVNPMNKEEIRNAIEIPAKINGFNFEPGLVDLLIDNSSESDALPLLQDTLRTLWFKKNNQTLTHQSYKEIGGLWGALNNRADKFFNALTEKQKKICTQLFLRMVQPGEGTEDTRRRVKINELLTITEDNEITNELISMLSAPEQRLIRTSGSTKNVDNSFIEVTHEALIKNWKKLQTWIENNRETLKTHRRLTEASEEWENKERDKSYLFIGARLAELEEWTSDKKARMNKSEQAFFEACIAERKAEEERQKNELIAAKEMAEAQKKLRNKAENNTKIVAGIMVLALIFAFTTWQQYNNSKSRFSIYLFSEAQKAFEIDNPRLALLLGQEALKYDANNKAVDSLVNLQLPNFLGLTYRNSFSLSYNFQFKEDYNYLSFMTDMGEKGKTGTINILNLETTNNYKFLKTSPRKWSFNHRNDSTYINFLSEVDVDSNIGTLSILNLDSGNTRKFPKCWINYKSYRYSKDNSYLGYITSIGKYTKKLNLLNLENDDIREFYYCCSYSDMYKFSSDSKYLSFIKNNRLNEKTLNILNLESNSLKRISRHNTLVNSDDFIYSNNTKYIAYITNGKMHSGTLNIQNLETSNVFKFPNSSAFPSQNFFSKGSNYSFFFTNPNSKERTGVLNVLNLTTKNIQKFSNCLESNITSSNNGNYLTFITDPKFHYKETGIFNILNLKSGELIKFPNSFSLGSNNNQIFSKDDRYLIFSSEDGFNENKETLKILNLETRDIQEYPNCSINSVQYSNNNRFLSFISEKNDSQIGVLTILDLHSGKVKKNLNVYNNYDNHFYEDRSRYSLDNKFIYFYSDIDNKSATMNILNLQSGENFQIFNVYNNYRFIPNCYSNNSRYFSTLFSEGKVLKVWDIISQKEVMTVEHQQKIEFVKFSENGRFIYTYSHYPGSNNYGVLKVSNLKIPKENLLEYYNKVYPPFSKEERRQFGL